MSEPWLVEKRQRANASLSQLLEAYPGLSVDHDEPAWREGTNLVAFGEFEGDPVVLKYYDWQPRREQEEKALQLFAPSGLVPRLYPVDSDSVLVMERLRGSTLHCVGPGLEQETLRSVYCHLGRGIARIVRVAPGGPAGGRHDLQATRGFDYEFYCRADIGDLFGTVTDRAAEVLAEHEVPHRTVLEASLLELRKERDALLAYQTFIQMDDIHTNNVMVDGHELTGFIDLEMTRYGNEVFLLAAALAMTLTGRPEGWAWIRQGYEDVRGPMDGRLLSLIRVAAPFSQWCRFMWYWTGDPREFEEGARGWPVRDIKAIAEAAGALGL